MTERKEIIEKLSKIDVSQFVKEKIGLKYLSWADAWAILTEYFPDSHYSFIEYPEYVLDKTGKWVATGRDVDYRMTNAGCEVTVNVYIKEQKFTMSLYVMDNRNKPVSNPNYAQINKTQQRCLVKALALAGLGLNLYQGEDLPSSESIRKRGISAEDQKMKKELLDAKHKMSMLLGEVAIATKQPTADIQAGIVEQIKNEYPDSEKMQPLEKFKLMIGILENMKKDATGKNSEQIDLEEV